AVLGLGQPRRVLQEQIERVEQLASAPDSPTDAQLMEVAGGMLYVEASMHGILAMERTNEQAAAGGQLSTTGALLQVQQQVVLEQRTVLEHNGEDISAFVPGQWDYTPLELGDAILPCIGGGLAMLPLNRAADAVAVSRLYFKR